MDAHNLEYSMQSLNAPWLHAMHVPIVRPQMSLLYEPLWADVALEGPLPGVGATVPLQLCPGKKSLGAVWPFAAMRLPLPRVVRMGGQMLTNGLHVHEEHLAQVAQEGSSFLQQGRRKSVARTNTGLDQTTRHTQGKLRKHHQG